MKKLLLSILIVGSATFANAQKSEVADAKKKWNIFAYAGNGLAFDKKMASLNEGLAHTDKAIVNEKSKDLAETWAYRALFSSAIAVTDTINDENSLAKQKIAEEALVKVKALDAKNAEKDNVYSAEVNIRNATMIRGMKAYKKKDYATALNVFEQLIVINPQDTSMYLNAGVTAKLIKEYPKAINHFKKVISFNTPEARDLYAEIIAMNLNDQKDTTAALASLKEALAKFPDDGGFIGSQTDIFIAKGDIEKSQESLTKLIAKDPSKAVYHYLMGDTYYKQALNMQEERKKIDSKKVKEFNAATTKMNELIDKSIPFYKKSLEIDPKYIPTLETLKQIYAFKNDNVNYEDIKKRLDAIPAN